jgi:transcriptional regulator with XRE-family HTH domain
VLSSHPLILFGKRLRELRVRKKLSREKLAEIADVHRNYVGLLERGQSNVSLLTVVALAHALGVKPAKLIEPIP